MKWKFWKSKEKSDSCCGGRCCEGGCGNISAPQTIRNIMINSANTKHPSDTVLFIVYYLNVDGMPRSRATEEINQFTSLYKITDEEKRKMGFRAIKEIWLPTFGVTKVDVFFG